MLKRISIRTRLLLLAALAGTMLCTALGYADQPDADLVKQGTAALKQHDYDVAIAKFSEAIRLAPNDAEAWGRRGEAYAAKGKIEDAVADCAQGVKLAPNSSEAHGRCGYVYYHANEFERAIAAYDTAIKLDPRIASAYTGRGLAYSRLEQTDRAISDFDQALKLDPSQSDVYVVRGNAWLVKGDFDRAWDDFNRALEADPKNAYAYVSRGYAAAWRYDFDDAIADYDRAISIDPTYKDAYRYRDEALKHKSDTRWGYAYLVLISIGMLALVFAAFRTYNSPTAFSHGVERHFERNSDGRLVFYPKMKGAGYFVPDNEKEQELRLFVRRSRAAALAYGVLGPVLMFVLVLPSMAVLTRLQLRTGISTSAAISVASFGCVSAVLGGGLILFSRWRRAAVSSLVEVVEKREPPSSDQQIDDFVLDMPVAVRWIVLALMLFLVFQSLKGLWHVGHKLSLAHIESMSLFDWLRIGSYPLVLWCCGKLLVYAARQLGRRADQAEKPA
jgi:tetratricopeptide (TPR) repeat protein